MASILRVDFEGGDLGHVYSATAKTAQMLNSETNRLEVFENSKHQIHR